MNPIVILLIIALAIANNVSVPQIYNPDFQNQGALTWQTFSRFRWWRPKPTFTPAPVVIPEHRPVMTPMPAARSDVHLVPDYSPKPTPMMSPRHDSSSRQGGGESNNSFKAVEREITVLSQSGNFISPDHYQRLSNSLKNLESQGYSKSEIERLRKMLAALNDSNIQTIGTTAPPAVSAGSVGGGSALCISNSIIRPVLRADFTDLSKVLSIGAPGAQSSEGPKGHSFINTDYQLVPVYAPIDAVLDNGTYYRDTPTSPAQYILTFEIGETCNYQFRFDHIDYPTDAIKAAFPTTPRSDSRGIPATSRIAFKAGDLVGYTKGTPQAGNWDFGLYNMKEEGPLAKYGSYGMHRQAVCWVDYYTPAKQAIYRKLLNGTQIVCSFGSSSTPSTGSGQATLTPESSSNGSPVIKNLGVLFGSWDRNTNRAGAFVFTPSRDKLFLEYGAEVSSATGGTKVLPTFEYYTSTDADVFAAVDGEVVTVNYQDRDQDYEILIRPDGASQWALGHDHVTNLKISKGMRVKAGDVLGKVGMSNGYGRTEIMLWTSSGGGAPLTYCPTKFFDAQLRSSLEQKVRQHMKDWEEFKGNPSIYNEEKHVFPGCAFESLKD